MQSRVGGWRVFIRMWRLPGGSFGIEALTMVAVACAGAVDTRGRRCNSEGRGKWKTSARVRVEGLSCPLFWARQRWHKVGTSRASECNVLLCNYGVVQSDSVLS